MAEPPREQNQNVQRLDALNEELDRHRSEIDAARAAFNRRKLPDRRAHPRSTPDRRIIATAR